MVLAVFEPQCIAVSGLEIDSGLLSASRCRGRSVLAGNQTVVEIYSRRVRACAIVALRAHYSNYILSRVRSGEGTTPSHRKPVAGNACDHIRIMGVPVQVNTALDT